MIIMTDDQDQRCYSCWYVIKKSNQYICYFEKNNKPNQKDNKPYWPKVYPITKTSNCLRDIVDYVHKFGGSKFTMVNNYQCGSEMDYNTIISKI